jgi:hypothetical protein
VDGRAMTAADPMIADGLPEFPSVDAARPREEGGPAARFGFDYQDEVAVGFLVEMLEDPALLKVHCETHDDVLLVRAADGAAQRLAEFVQVKAGEPDKLWSVADLCARKDGRTGTSILEASLARDAHRESSRFRIVTLRPVAGPLKILTYPHGAPGREPGGERLASLRSELDRRFPSLRSPKGNGAAYWLENCRWHERHSEDAVRKDNLVRLMRLSLAEGRPLLLEPAEALLEELRALARAAGVARWEPDRDRKIIGREVLRAWWERRTRQLAEGAARSGGPLSEKMADAGLPDELVALAVEMRRDYAAAARVPRYMEEAEGERLQRRVKAELASLRARLVAGQIDLDGAGFHALCLERMDLVNAERPLGGEDRSAFLKGCMYDIADRCLHRFARPAR